MSGRVVIRLESRPVYKRDAFAAGFEKIGYIVDLSPRPKRITKEDVLVIWNRNPPQELMAKQFEDAGATVIVAENGYIGLDKNGDKLVALSKGHHNGLGEWNTKDYPARPLELKPWRKAGSKIVILAQRGIGERGVAQPQGWEFLMLRYFEKISKRKILIKSHPGTTKQSLEPYFQDCWAAVTWGSSAGIKALAAGIPVFYGLKGWIGGLAGSFSKDIENPFYGEREKMFTRLSWAQWEVDQIASGEALSFLLWGK